MSPRSSIHLQNGCQQFETRSSFCWSQKPYGDYARCRQSSGDFKSRGSFLRSCRSALYGNFCGRVCRRSKKINTKVRSPQRTQSRSLERSAASYGPIIRKKPKSELKIISARALRKVPELLVDGRNYKHPTHPHGNFVGPSMFSNVTGEMSIYTEEIFGPVLCAMSVDTFKKPLH